MSKRFELPPLFWGCLLLILLGTMFLRAYQLDWGLPSYYVPDEAVFTAETAERILSGPAEPADFIYPHLQIRIVAGLQSVLGQMDRLEGIWLGRRLNVAYGIGAVLLTFLIGCRLFDRRVAIVSAAFLAVAPYAVVNAHINGSDGPLYFWTTASFLLSAIGLRSGRSGWLLAAGLLAGVAGAVKYQGLAAAVPPVLACLGVVPSTGRLEIRSASRAFLLAAAVGFAGLVGFYAGCPRCVANLDVCVEGIQLMAEVNYTQGASAARPAEGWLSYPYWFPIVAVLPFCLGALSCALSYVGAASLLRRARYEALLIASFVLPYFLVIGGSAANYPRYYLPMLPFLCLAAGFLVCRGLESTAKVRIVAIAAMALSLVHSLLVSVALARGFNEEGREQVVSELTSRAGRLAAGRAGSAVPTVGLAPFVAKYDGLRPALEQDSRVELAAYRPDPQWLKRKGPDFLIFSSPFLLRSLRFDATQGQSFWADLTSGKLGYERVAQIQPSFEGGGIYAALDPLLVNAWTNGDIGYSIFQRTRARAPSPRGP